MSSSRRIVLALPTLLCLLSTPAWAAAASGNAGGGTLSAAQRALLRSRELWATIDVCNARDQPNVLGIRGSMPGDGQAHRMYMSFRLQYLQASPMRWVNLASDVPSYVAVGSGASARQGGRSFVIAPVAGKPAFALRGVVGFQWRRGKKVLVSVSRPTTEGHQSLAGADPAGFSAASCLIG